MATIQNIVSTAKLNCNFDLNSLHQQFPNSKYRPEKFPPVIFKLEKATCLLFYNGKVNCLGAKSFSDSHAMIKELMHQLCAKGYACKLTDFCVKNILATGSLGFELDVTQFYETQKQADADKWVFWDPTIFPGLQFRFKQLNVTVVVFASGKFTISGAQNFHSINSTYQQFCRIAKKYKRGDTCDISHQ
jgi:transcription initiation factor TFIID TATA-box-binding protein